MTQEGNQSRGWPQDMQDDHLVAGVGDDEFTNFLDLDDNSFSQFTNMAQTSSGLDTPMGRLAFGSGTTLNYSGQDQMDMSIAPTHNAMSYNHPVHSSAAYSQFQQYPQMQMQPHYHVPLTPVSAEMQAAKYVQQVGNNGQILFDQQQVCLYSAVDFKYAHLHRFHSHPWFLQPRLLWTEGLSCPTMVSQTISSAP